jgi:hypothetical protein
MAVLAPTSNVCLRVEDPDGVQKEHKQFILVRAKECPTSCGRGESCIILHRSAYSRGYKQVREGGTPRSQYVSGVCVYVFASDELNDLWICLLSIFFFVVVLGMVPSLPFYRCKGNAGLHACAT